MASITIPNFTVAAAIFNNREKILIVSGLDQIQWWLPGGDLFQGEEEENGLRRMISDQLSGTKIHINDGIPPIVLEYKEEKRTYKMFLCSSDGRVYSPSGRLNAAEFVNYNQLQKYNVLDMPKLALSRLRKGRSFC